MDKVLSLSFADWFVKIQPVISHTLLFLFFEGEVGGKSRQEVFFQTCECNTQQPSLKVPAAPAKKGQTSPFHVSYVQLEMSQLCHNGTKHAWCLFFQKVS